METNPWHIADKHTLENCAPIYHSGYQGEIICN